MPNHFHFFVRVKDDVKDDKLANAFKNFFISYAKSMNKRYERTGGLFEGRFRRKELKNEAYFSRIIACIHLNPIKAGLVSLPQDWKYSSYNAILSSKSISLIKEEILR